MAIAEEMKNLAEEIVASYGTRVATVNDLIKETRKTLKDFQVDHREMAKALKIGLAQGESQRLGDFKALNTAIKGSVEEIVKETARLLSDFAKEQKEMAAALKEVLAKGESTRMGDFRTLHAGIQHRQGERVAEIRATLSSFRKDQEEAHKHWQNLAKVMAAKHAGKEAPKPKAAERVPEKAEEVKKEVPSEERMTYKEFFAYHRPRVEGSSKERMIKIGKMWREYQSAGK